RNLQGFGDVRQDCSRKDYRFTHGSTSILNESRHEDFNNSRWCPAITSVTCDPSRIADYCRSIQRVPGEEMRMFRWTLLLVIVFSAVVSTASEKALVTSMKKVKCGARIAKFSVIETLAGPDTITPELSCMEFTLRTPKVQYRLRPDRQMLLPVGFTVSVR